MSISAIKTVVSTAASLYAGASELPGRQQMIVRNTSDCIAITVGSTLTSGKVYGYTIEPQEREIISIYTPTTIYAQSKGAAVMVEVTEA